jgi:hypothetical protein
MLRCVHRSMLPPLLADYPDVSFELLGCCEDMYHKAVLPDPGGP